MGIGVCEELVEIVDAFPARALRQAIGSFNARIAPITPLIASGDNEWAPNDPGPPELDTAAVNRCDDSPPSRP